MQRLLRGTGLAWVMAVVAWSVAGADSPRDASGDLSDSSEVAQFVTAVEPADSVRQASPGQAPGAATETCAPRRASRSTVVTYTSAVEHLPARDISDIIALQPGTVQRGYGAPVHVRGGAVDETVYYVDGFSRRDPYTGLSITPINNNLLRSLTLVPSGADAAYGNALSGRVTANPKTRTYVLEYATDKFHSERSDYALHSFALLDPDLFSSQRVGIALSGERRTLGKRDPGGPGYWDWLWNWRARLNWRPTEKSQIALGTIGAYQDTKFFRSRYLFNSVHAPRTVDENYSVWGRITHRLGAAHLNLAVNWFQVKHESGDGVHFGDLFAYGRPAGNPRNDQTRLFRSWDDLDIDEQGNRIITPSYDSVISVSLPDGSVIEQAFTFGDEGHVWDDYVKWEESYLGGRFDLAYTGAGRHDLKLGAELQRHTVRSYQNFFTTIIHRGVFGGFDDIAAYGYDLLGQDTDTDGLNGAKHPINAAAYVQDRLTFGSLTITGGLRLDYLDHDTKRLRDPRNPLDPDNLAALGDTSTTLPPDVRDSLRIESQRMSESDLEKAESFTRLSPRISAAQALTENTVLYASYGRHVQRPAFRDVYADFDFMEYKIKSGGYSVLFGSASLQPAENWTAEIGMRQRLATNAGLGITFFYKDYRNLPVAIFHPDRYVGYLTLASTGEAIAQGIELHCEWRPRRSLSTRVNYTWQDAKQLWVVDSYRQNHSWTQNPITSATIQRDFDQTHKITVIVNVSSGEGEGPRLGRFHPLERVSLSLAFSAGSGFPYTSTPLHNEFVLGVRQPLPAGQVNSERGPAMYRLDLKVNKGIGLLGRSLDFYLWVLNAFDRDNAVDVYGTSGEPDRTGWLEGVPGQEFAEAHSQPHDSSYLTGAEKYRLRESDRSNFDISRQIRIGMRLIF